MYTPQQRFLSGVSSELFISHVLVELGYEIFFPVLTQSKCDLIALKNSIPIKVQCKKASWSKTLHNHEYLQARIHGKSKRDPSKFYTAEDIDLFCITDNSRVWLIPFEQCGHMTSICLDSNNPKYKPQTKYDAKEWLVWPKPETH